jgi:serine/threonine-protein kinase 11
MYSQGERLIQPLDSGSDSDARPKLRKRINEFVLLQSIGRGSFAKVFLAYDLHLKTYFAIKRFRLKELQRIDSGVSQLEREILAMRKIFHENIIRLHSVLPDEQTEVVYLVLDYADYGSLDKLLRSSLLDPPLVKYVFVRVLSAVAYLHSRGVIHQDIKPANILLSGSGGVFLSDFGVGHSFQSTAMVVGSPAYQAPEAISDDDGECDWECNPVEEDVWSLGVTLYQCLWGRLPFVGENVYEIIQDIRSRPVEIPVGTDPELVALLRGMLCVDPGKRWTMDQVRASAFFAGAPDKVQLPVARPDAGLLGRHQIVHARVCDENYSFALQCGAPMLGQGDDSPPRIAIAAIPPPSSALIS